MNNDCLKILQSGSDEQIIQALKECRITGSDLLIRELMLLLDRTHNPLIHNEVAGILNDLNNQSSAEELMRHLPSFKTHAIFPDLVGACWQNNLDYSAYIEFFIEVVLEGDYAASIEAFTVVENNITMLDDPTRDFLAQKIQKAKAGISPDKYGLVDELYATVKTFSGPFRIDLS
ncbi:MAG: hypothetical protein IH594_09285 [Bacteroidales bacterium]|nr:hypothetical protein [Bacteroidales bacterium]